jgi:hypothetical protein
LGLGRVKTLWEQDEWGLRERRPALLGSVCSDSGHKQLPVGRRRFVTVLPGIAMTLLLWLIAGELFGDDLARFACTCVTYYAGLASAMIALVFLYVIAKGTQRGDGNPDDQRSTTTVDIDL